MTISRTAVVGFLILLLMSACNLSARGTNHQDLDTSCRSFVQGFYDWYVPQALDENGGRAWELALQLQGQVFSPELFQQLKADAAAQEAADGDIVGLDFDPFLACQDCEAGYGVGGITLACVSCRAEVYRIRSDPKSQAVAVVPEVILLDGRWQFIDFHYLNPSRPEFASLLNQLSFLRMLERQQTN